MKVSGYALSDIGMKRKINQDAFLKDDALSLYVVADGMGGHKGGEVASRIAVEEIQKFCREHRDLPPRDRLNQGVNRACQEIFKHSGLHEELAGMGTTVLALLVHEGTVYIAQVGDSRVYLLSQGGIWQVTEDHSLLNEEIRAGRIDASQAASYQFKNVITRSVGYENKVVVDIYSRKAKQNDMFLMCSDGLSGLVEAEEMLAEVKRGGPETGLKNLISLANSRGGDDNITALICHIES